VAAGKIIVLEGGNGKLWYGHPEYRQEEYIAAIMGTRKEYEYYCIYQTISKYHSFNWKN
jgi:hypothetical protein